MTAGAQPSRGNKRFIILFVIPLASCVVSSIIGIIIGQAGNLLYAMTGGVPNVVCIPAYCFLFLFTAGASFLVNLLLKRWFYKTKGPA